MNETRRTPKAIDTYTQGDYVARFTDQNGNEHTIPKGAITYTLYSEEDNHERRNTRKEGKEKFNLLESWRRFERWFNLKWGWFFTNPMK